MEIPSKLTPIVFEFAPPPELQSLPQFILGSTMGIESREEYQIPITVVAAC